METLEGIQQAFVEAIKNGEDTASFIENFITADCDLSRKYMVINMESLLDLNGQVGIMIPEILQNNCVQTRII